MCFVWIWEQTAIISLYSIDWLVFITETECVYCAVRYTFYVLPTLCIYVFCVDLRTNSDYFTILHQRTACLHIIQIDVILNSIPCQCMLNLWQQSGTGLCNPSQYSSFPPLASWSSSSACCSPCYSLLPQGMSPVRPKAERMCDGFCGGPEITSRDR
jgi:hypothetical protein